jgi:DNA-binding CsgD family transcriptional regulator
MQQGQLSPREGEVAALIARGKTNAEIALSLGLSASTVKHYVEMAMRKAGVTSRVSLAMWWRDHEEGAG